jgi:hypothetical protein
MITLLPVMQLLQETIAQSLLRKQSEDWVLHCGKSESETVYDPCAFSLRVCGITSHISSQELLEEGKLQDITMDRGPDQDRPQVA